MEKLCIDIDNVIAQTDEVIRDVIREHTGGWVNFDYEHIQKFDYHECRDANGHQITSEDWKTIHRMFSERARLLSVKPYPFVQTRLRELSNTFTIHLATSRLPKARRATVEWLERHCFDLVYDLHFVQHGEKHTSLGRFTASIEDDLDQAMAFAKAGVMSFIVDHPWNQHAPDPSPNNLRRVVGEEGVRIETVWNVLRNEILKLVKN